MTTFTVGQEVRILSRRSRYSRVPEGGYVGTVVKVGRKYATATYVIVSEGYGDGEQRRERTIEFDIRTGIERGASSSYGDYVKTPEQLEAGKRQAQALATLKAAGFETRRGHHPSPELVEALAEVVRTFTTEGG